MSFEDVHRGPAAADLGERTAKRLREGLAAGAAAEVYLCAMDVLTGLDPQERYEDGLLDLGLSLEEADAASAKIQAGEHPAGSLPGEILGAPLPAPAELDRLRAIERLARAVMAATAILGGGAARGELVRLLDEAAAGRDLEVEQERYQDAKRELLVWCEKMGVGAPRREIVAEAFKNRVADRVGPKRAGGEG